MTGAEIAIGAGITLIVGAIGYGAKGVLSNARRIAVVEANYKSMHGDVAEIKKDVKCIDQKFQRLLGRLDNEQ